MLGVFFLFFVLLASSHAASVNYVVVLIDDLGFNDLNLGKDPFTRTVVNTPNLKQMAEEGVLFDNFYTGASICTPSRGALLTGQFTISFNWFAMNRVFLSPGQISGIPDTKTTLAQFFKNCGYTTGMTGKWHLGRSQSSPEDVHWMPLQKGFDHAEQVFPMSNGPMCTAGEVAPCQQQTVNGVTSSYYPLCPTIDTNDCPFRNLLPPNCTFGVQVPVGGTAGPDPRRNAGFCSLYRGNTVAQQPWEIANLTQRLTQEAIKFFDARSTFTGDGRPFFFYMPHVAVHQPFFASSKFFGKSQMGPYGDMVEEMDWSVGQVLDRLRQPDIGPTLVVFLSDNGAYREVNVDFPDPNHQTSSGKLRGGKGQHYEGGVRTPAIVWGNAALSTVYPTFQRNVLTHAVGHIVDIYKTFQTQQSTCTAPTGLNGVDLTPVLLGLSQDSRWQNPAIPFNYLPYFCENILTAVRWRDPGNATLNIPARDLKILFALPTWTVPSSQICPVPNPYAPSVCSCQTLQRIDNQNGNPPPQLFDIRVNVGEDPAQNLLNPLFVGPVAAAYYAAKGQQAGAYVLSAPQPPRNWDTNPLSLNGLYDIRTTTPLPDTGALLSCPGDPTTCTINSESGATKVTLTSFPNPSYYGQKVSFNAFVSSVSSGWPILQGSVFLRLQFPHYQAALGPQLSLGLLGVCYNTTDLAVTSYRPITAEYQGQPPIHLASTSTAVIQVVKPAVTEISLVAAPKKIKNGKDLNLVSALLLTHGGGIPTGTITWKMDGVPFEEVPLTSEGVGVYHTKKEVQGVGVHTFTAEFTSNTGNYLSAASAPQTVTVW